MLLYRIVGGRALFDMVKIEKRDAGGVTKTAQTGYMGLESRA